MCHLHTYVSLYSVILFLLPLLLLQYFSSSPLTVLSSYSCFPQCFAQNRHKIILSTMFYTGNSCYAKMLGSLLWLWGGMCMQTSGASAVPTYRDHNRTWVSSSTPPCLDCLGAGSLIEPEACQFGEAGWLANKLLGLPVSVYAWLFMWVPSIQTLVLMLVYLVIAPSPSKFLM